MYLAVFGHCPHHEPKFLPWHRLYSLKMERLLGLPLPYWDFAERGDVPQLWASIKPDVPGPANFDSSMQQECTGNPNYVIRKQGININEDSNKKGMFNAYMQDDFRKFMNLLDSPHMGMHVEMGCHMQQGQKYPPYDPMFWLIHSAVDRQFALWQVTQFFVLSLACSDQPSNN